MAIHSMVIFRNNAPKVGGLSMTCIYVSNPFIVRIERFDV